MEEDGFQLVRCKRKKGKCGLKRLPFVECRPETDEASALIPDNDIDRTMPICVEQMTSKLLILAEEVQRSDYFSIHLLPCLKDCMDPNEIEMDLVCYGLGNFLRCQIAAYQFALLVCLRSSLKFRCVYVYDPVFIAEEQTVISCDRISFQLIVTNEECRRTVHRPTLFYMPHCDRQLYNNLLAANWGQKLADVKILGNSFTRMRDTSIDMQMDINLPHIANCFDYLDEYSIRNDFKYSDIFNDTSIHVFNPMKPHK